MASNCDEYYDSLGKKKKEKSDNFDVAVMKIKVINPSVHLEDYDGPLHHLKSLFGDGKGFTINLRFDINSNSDLQKFVDYFTDLTDEVDTMNMSFSKNKYRAVLDIEFSKAAIVKEE